MISADEAIVTYSRITKDSVVTKNVNDFTTDAYAFEGRSYSEIDCAGLIANALARYASYTGMTKYTNMIKLWAENCHLLMNFDRCQ